MKKIIIILVIVVIGLGLFWKYWWGVSNNVVNYRVIKVEKGDIIQTVNATGIVQPIKLVQVGTQVNGSIKKLYANFNSRVKEGDVVAQIDPDIYQAQVDQDEANLISSEANVEQIKANLVLAEKELARSQELADSDLISQSDLDSAIANRDSLVAQLKKSEASVKQSKSALQMSEVKLGYTTIKSPVDGIVISRNVDEGQTVVANMSVQNIFTIATDLKKMQIEANIPEADIGKIRVKQSVIFTVDAYPDIEFSGQVSEVRLSPTTVSNVVTYTVIISADNPDELLFPGMTANLICRVNYAQQVLRISNDVLRFSPDAALIQNQGSSEANNSASNQNGQYTQVWVRSDTGLLKAVPIKTGITDGSFTEIISGGLSEGQEIVTGVLEKGEVAAENMVNPFGPPRPPGAQKTSK